MLNLALPPDIQDNSVKRTISEIIRRGIDSTVIPIFVDNNNVINIGASSGAINKFFLSIVAGFNKQVIFYDNIACQRNMCISGDLVVSGTLQASVIIAKKMIVSEIVEP